LHEWSHVKFDLPEEYGQNTCDCVMSTGKTIRSFYCDRTNHRGSGESCWERVLKAYPAWKEIPGDPGEAPKLEFSFEDR
jgi:hypothetical protein